MVFYQGAEIIGYAHIQFWLDQRAAIRIIAIDEERRNNSLGTVFLNLIEKWLSALGIKSIHAESRLSSLRFYLKNGYTEMPFNDPLEHESQVHAILENVDHSEVHSEDIAVGKILNSSENSSDREISEIIRVPKK